MLVFPVGHLKFPNSSCLKGISVSLLVSVWATFVVVVERSILSSISFYSPVHWQQRLFYSISTYYITIRVHRHSKITLTFLHTVYLKPLEILILKCKMTVGIMKDYNSESLIYLFSLFLWCCRYSGLFYGLYKSSFFGKWLWGICVNLLHIMYVTEIQNMIQSKHFSILILWYYFIFRIYFQDSSVYH